MIEELRPSDFRAFFRGLHGYDPFPWQERLAKRVCETGWPDTLDLPTASGKTACIDVAVFAMAVQGRGPRRVFFVVDRRVVVDAAYERMGKIAAALREAADGVVKTAADRLRAMAQSDEPIDTYQLRGGIYRDDSWVRSPLQPTLIASTVDQVGSRLLFRGYGVGETVWPIHAALTANDSLILLDEAHCSRPFCETLAAVQRYRGEKWREASLDTPFAWVEMTATPARPTGDVFRLEEEDYRHPELRKRLYASKRVRLVESKAKAKDTDKLAEHLADEALRLAKEPGLMRIAVMVNRIRTARRAFAALEERGCRAHLLIGRMRPVDRSALPQDLTAMLAGTERRTEGAPVFVVATQCLEVGADLDFDAIVTECASIDALLQRFGRLDRIGKLREAGVTARGRIVIASEMADSKYHDPIYGGALARTWNWLKEGGEEPDLGICSETGNQTVRERLALLGEGAEALRRGAPPAAVLLPSHLDALAQTCPRPAVEPDVHFFLHGMETGSPETQVVWRADLDLDRPDDWAEIVGLCPPVSTEAMPVPLRDFRTWATGRGDEGATSSDIEGADDDAPGGENRLRCPVLRWRGEESEIVEDAGRIRPGDTLVLAKSSGGWDELGHIPRESSIDVAERARWELRRSRALRLHPELISAWPEADERPKLVALAKDPLASKDDLIDSLKTYAAQVESRAPNWLKEILDSDWRRAEPNAYPANYGTHVGWALTERYAEADSGQDEGSAAAPVFLDDHLADVDRAVGETASALLRDATTLASLRRAARLHDCGKADARFQALLRGGDPLAAQFAPRRLAKGVQARQSPAILRAQRARSGLPDGFRHELVSLALARQDPEYAGDDLALHLIASHHGRCRPFAPVVEDDGGDVQYNGRRIGAAERAAGAAHRIGSGVAERFWRLTRRYGWWGLAYLEALVRLGDWKASKDEAAAREKTR